MEERENILNYLVTKVGEITTTNGYPITVKTVSRQYKPYDIYSPFELPAVHIIDGNETRIYEGKRVLHDFTIIFRVIVYDEERVSTQLNQLIDSITQLMADDLYLNGLIILPNKIESVETDEGWLAPYSMADIKMSAIYSRLELNR